ncbi:hypothetical protein F4809DRAFT_661983 [Biscogniauxia mediterranea]|nr:hypothetical protein F4809DRAFT_661983 [Biscogniauxia mediterranea]
MYHPPNFWTLSTKRDFHKAVVDLCFFTRIPADEKDYRSGHPPHSEGYALDFEDERQLADDIAFLAHSSDDVESISAVTVLEEPESVTLLLASNHAPSDSTVTGLREIISIMKRYSSTRRNRRVYYDEVFDAIVRLCEKRILGRIHPAPRYNEPRRSLLSKILGFLNDARIRKLIGVELLEKMGDLVNHLRRLPSPVHRRPEKDHIKSIIKSCVAISTLNDTGSLENHLRSLGLPPKELCRAEIRQIDILSRYAHISRNLIKLARKQDFLSILGNIELKPLPAFPSSCPPGSFTECFVHAEMQQVLYLERYPCDPPPRVIGCSKSACYLCDLFIQTQGRYHISVAHRHLYPMWTLPDVDWMGSRQAEKFSQIVSNMTVALREAIRIHKRGFRSTQYEGYCAESRTRLPLPCGSTPSEVSRISQLVDDTNTPASANSDEDKEFINGPREVEAKYTADSHGEEAPKLMSAAVVGSTDSVISAKLSFEDLPFSREIRSGLSFIDIEVSYVRLCFDFTSVSTGHLRVFHGAGSEEEPISPSVDVSSIRSDEELKIGCSADRSSTRFHLLHATYPPVIVEFVWEASASGNS